MSIKSVVVVGAGHAGVNVAAALRSGGYAERLTVIEELCETPYERPPLSKELLRAGSPAASTPIRKPSFYSANDIQLVSGLTVVSINKQNKTLKLADSKEIPYDRLVLATGSSASKLQIAGGDLPGVQYLKTYEDALKIKSAIANKARLVIIGAGYIGLEVAAAAARACDVTVIEFQDRVMKRVTSDPVSRYFQKLHESNGVKIVLEVAVTAIEGRGRAERVVTSDGRAFDADLVVVGVGATPNQRIALEAGIHCKDGVIVDYNCQTSDPYIYAAGDVTRFMGPLEGQAIRLECVANAVAQSKIVAQHLLHGGIQRQEIPWFWTVQFGNRLQTAGVQSPEDKIIVRGKIDTGKFSVLYMREERLAAIDTVNALSDFVVGKRLIASKTKLSSERASDFNRGLAQASLGGERK